MNKVIEATRAVDKAMDEEVKKRGWPKIWEEEPNIELDPKRLAEEAQKQSRVEQHYNTTAKIIDQAQETLDKMQLEHQVALAKVHASNEEEITKQDRDIASVEKEIMLLQETLLDRRLHRTNTLHNMAKRIQSLVKEQTAERADQLHVLNSLKAMLETTRLPVDTPAVDSVGVEVIPTLPFGKVHIQKPEQEPNKTYVDPDADHNSTSSDSTDPE